MPTNDNSLFRFEINQDNLWEQENHRTSAQTVEVEVLPPVDLSDKLKVEIYKGITETDKKLSAINERIEELNSEIDSLTNHADGLDYAVAVASGILTGIVDSIFVGEIDIKGATKAAEKEISDKVKQKALKEKQDDTVKKAIEGAKKKGKHLSKEEINQIREQVKIKFNSDPNNLADTDKDPVLRRAIKYLEDKHPTPQDNLYKGTGSSPSNHHLDDIAHHASLVGMIASIVVQFLRVATFVNNEGKWQLKFVKTDPKELVELWLPIVISGLLNWLVYMAEKTEDNEATEKIPEPIFKIAHLLASAPAIISVIKAINNWCMHLYSDVAGSATSKGRGAGIPGLFISMLKEISSVPPLNRTGLPKVVDNLYTTKGIDLRTELGVIKELGRQTIPVIINELLVRTFYFIRRLIIEYKEHGSFSEINWHNVIPIGNRTVERMMTIASGTFTAFDIADAAIRSGGFNASCILRINFVGVGRFAIAIGTDIGMGIKKAKKERLRSETLSEYINLSKIKVYYRNADLLCSEAELYDKESQMHSAEKDVWKELCSTEESIQQLYEQINIVCQYHIKAIEEMNACLNDIELLIPHIDKNNPGLREKMLERLK
ncbi:MAG: hypothetical protein IJV88_02585 [Ruminococcus sp.]|nr:hypothetical protein [Ruminococcus sp.]